MRSFFLFVSTRIVVNNISTSSHYQSTEKLSCIRYNWLMDMLLNAYHIIH
jgi:hypothetical protein